MVQAVTLRKEEKKFLVTFKYNPDLVDIMKDFEGWFIPKEKAWQFPLNKFDAVQDALSKEGYRTYIQAKL